MCIRKAKASQAIPAHFHLHPFGQSGGRWPEAAGGQESLTVASGVFWGRRKGRRQGLAPGSVASPRSVSRAALHLVL